MDSSAPILMHCPHCGGALIVAPAAVPVRVSTCTSTSTSTSTAATQPTLPALPARATRTAKASPWKRAIAIAHRAIDEQPNESDQDEAFKRYCIQQGLDYGARNDEGRPLYARAMDFARQQRRRR